MPACAYILAFMADSQTATPAAPAQSSSEIILSMESLIKNHISSIEKLEEEYRKHKEMLDDIFANDKTYQEHLEKAQEATKIKTATKNEILKRPQAADLNTKVKSLKSEISETETALSDYLQEYARLSGLTEIETDDGRIKQIVYTVKLVSK